MTKQTALNFIDAVNAHDPEKIIQLMTDDHIFIDAYGSIQTKKEMERGWQGYFEWFPDYLIEISEIIETENTIAVFGFASGAYHGEKEKDGRFWRLPAAWRVVVENGKVKVWQVYCDSKIPFETMK